MITILALILTILGAYNWFSVAVFKFDFVAAMFNAGSSAVGARIIYGLIGVAGLWLLIYLCVKKFSPKNFKLKMDK